MFVSISPGRAPDSLLFVRDELYKLTVNNWNPECDLYPEIDKKKLLSDFAERRFTVRLKGLEPPRLSAPDPKSGAATNYATAAGGHFFDNGCKDTIFFENDNNYIGFILRK